MSAPSDPNQPLEPLDADLRRLIEREAASHDESAVVARELQRIEARLQAMPPREQPAANVVPLRPRRVAIVASSVGGALMAAAALWLVFIHPRQSSPSPASMGAPAAVSPAEVPSRAASAGSYAEEPSPASPPALLAPVAPPASAAAGPKQAASAPSRALDAGTPHTPPKKRN